MQKLINKSMIDISTEEGVSPEQVFFILLFFAALLIVMGYLTITFLRAKEISLWKFWGFF